MPTGCDDEVFPWGKNTPSPLDSKYLYGKYKQLPILAPYPHIPLASINLITMPAYQLGRKTASAF